mmetsp:Transcript_27984/g.82281  ORF Transcript_27984/g.82281 Transcript_27984/m.82281 type:complete len:216 (+) Transcript_27984:588-1235(+)
MRAYLGRHHGEEFLLEDRLLLLQIGRIGETFRNRRSEHLGVLLGDYHGYFERLGDRRHELCGTYDRLAVVDEGTEALLNVAQKERRGLGCEFADGALGGGCGCGGDGGGGGHCPGGGRCRVGVGSDPLGWWRRTLSHRPRPKERRRRGGSAAGDEGGRRREDDRRRSEDGGNGDVSEKGGDSGRTVRTHLPLLLEPSWVVRFNDTIDSIRFDSIP